MEINSNGVREANLLIITELLLKKPAQILRPRYNAETTISPETTVSLRVTIMACLARSGFPAPNSFDTLVLQDPVGFFVAQWSKWEEKAFKWTHQIKPTTLLVPCSCTEAISNHVGNGFCIYTVEADTP